MSREQRWAASGVVVLLGALWGCVGAWTVSEPYRWNPPSDHAGTGMWVFAVGLAILTTTVLWLVAGLTAIRRVAAGEWRWRRAAGLAGLGALLSVLGAGATWSTGDELVTALLAFQAVAHITCAALLWTPAPVTPARTDAA